MQSASDITEVLGLLPERIREARGATQWTWSDGIRFPDCETALSSIVELLKARARALGRMLGSAEAEVFIGVFPESLHAEFVLGWKQLREISLSGLSVVVDAYPSGVGRSGGLQLSMIAELEDESTFSVMESRVVGDDATLDELVRQGVDSISIERLSGVTKLELVLASRGGQVGFGLQRATLQTLGENSISMILNFRPS